MKFSSISLIATLGLVCTQVGASPLRVIFAASSESHPLRIGHAAVPENIVRIDPATSFPPTFKPSLSPSYHHPDGKKKACGMRAKAMQVSNWIRIKFGFPAVAHHHTHHGHHGHKGQANSDVVNILPMPFLPPASGPNHVTTIHHIQFVPNPEHGFTRSHFFFGRLHQALMSLGPWEGRAVAFVLGCGIGSLLRMLWVLAVVSFRSFKSEAPRDEAEAELLYDQDEFEEAQVLPLKYADEKVAVEEGRSKA